MEALKRSLDARKPVKGATKRGRRKTSKAA
jgi:hypothetical protein